MNPSNINEIVRKHGLWLEAKEGGERANLQDANLRYANLQGANLQDANLQGANLRYANLQDANLQYANLQGANLRYANLQYANLQGANLQYAKQIICLLVHDPRGYRFIAVEHDDGYRIAAGCRWFTVEQAREHWGDPDYDGPKEVAAQVLTALDALPMEVRG